MSNFAIGLNSALGSYQQAQRHSEESKRRDRAEARAIGDEQYRRQVDAENREFRQKSFDATQDYRKQQLAIGASESKFRQDMAQKNYDLRAQADKRSAQIHQQKFDQSFKRELAGRADKAWRLAIEANVPMPDDLHQELLENGMQNHSIKHYLENPQLIQSYGKLGPVIRGALENPESVNSPESLAVLNEVYESEIKRGVGGAKAPFNTKIINQSLAGLKLAPGGRHLVAELDNELEDRAKYRAPRTLNASTEHSDPVSLIDVGTFVDDATGRYQISQFLSQPGVYDKLKQIHAINTGAKPVEAKPVSAQGKLYQDLIKMGGFSEADAKKMAFESKNDKAEFIRKYTLGRINNLMPGKENAPKSEDFVKEAKEAYSRIYPDSPEPNPVDGINVPDHLMDKFKTLRANPKNKGYSDEQLLQALASKTGE